MTNNVLILLWISQLLSPQYKVPKLIIYSFLNQKEIEKENKYSKDLKDLEILKGERVDL